MALFLLYKYGKPRLREGAQRAGRPEPADLYLLNVGNLPPEVCQGIPEDRIIHPKMTFRRDSIDQLRPLPSGTSLLMVHRSLDMAMESIANVLRLGIHSLDFHPYSPGTEVPPGCHIAATAGLPEMVPPGMDTVIDLGPRLFQAATIAEIALKLDLPDVLETPAYRDYTAGLAVGSYSLESLSSKASGMESKLTSLLGALPLGIIGVDRDDVIFAYNAAAERMLGVPKAEVLNRPVPQTAALLPRAFFLSAESGQASGRDAHIVRFHHTDFSVSSAPIVRKGAVKGYFTMLQPFAEEERTQQKLRLQMLKKGYTTKYCFDDIIAECPEMVRAKTIAEKMAATDASILLVGESGTGKELFAHSIHHSSPRKDMPCVAINCAALPEDLLESELFGYAEGAFTGAKKGGKLGLFEYAHHGTLFLDEIEGMSPNLQVKLLRVLQEKEIMRVGGSDIIPAGAFDVNPETKATIAGTFHYIDKTPVAPWTALGYIYDGMVSLAGTICLLLYFGGIFGVFLSLGAAEEVVNGIVVRMQGKADTLIIFVLTFLMSTIGAFAANNALIAFCALGAIVSRKMKLDPLVGIGIFFYGTFVGFASGPMCAYVAQGIAGVELYSGCAPVFDRFNGTVEDLLRTIPMQ